VNPLHREKPSEGAPAAPFVGGLGFSVSVPSSALDHLGRTSVDRWRASIDRRGRDPRLCQATTLRIGAGVAVIPTGRHDRPSPEIGSVEANSVDCAHLRMGPTHGWQAVYATRCAQAERRELGTVSARDPRLCKLPRCASAQESRCS